MPAPLSVGDAGSPSSAMAEIRRISAKHVLPDDQDWVLIEPIVGGGFVANGSARQGKAVVYYTPATFKSENSAIMYARIWADANGVPVIYVRAAPKP